MRKVLIVAILCLLSLPAFARGGHGGGHSYHASSRSSYHARSCSSHRAEHVGGYTRRDGHHVSSYRRAPAGTAVHSSSAHARSFTSHRSVTASGGRDKHGRIKRSESAKRDFMRQTGYPHGRPGYVIDHRIALACGGADAPSNMQWQTKAEGKAKDKWERKGCGR